MSTLLTIYIIWDVLLIFTQNKITIDITIPSKIFEFIWQLEWIYKPYKKKAPFFIRIKVSLFHK